jgi:hypothetical protein
MNVDPRTVAIAAVIVGILLILQGLGDIVFGTGPVHVSSPVPGLANWLVATFGAAGVRVLGDLILLGGGVLCVIYGRRALTARSRADAP